MYLLKNKGLDNMKFKCTAEDFSNALNKVIRAISSKKDTPMLESVKISAYNNEVVLYATDINLTIIKKIKAEVIIDGEILVPGKELAGFTKSLTDQIEIEAYDNKFKIYYSGSEVEFNCFKTEDYPKEIDFEVENEIEIQSKKLKTLIRKTMFSVSVLDDKAIFKGCYFIKENNILKFVGVDGKRIAVAKEEILENKKSVFDGIIPLRTADEILKLLEDNNFIKFKTCKNKILIEYNDTILISTLIEGEFIKFNDIMQINNPTEVVVEKKLLKESIERIIFVLNTKSEKNNLVKIEFTEDEMKLTTSSNIVSKVVEKVPIYLNGKDITIAINIKFLESCLSVIEEEFIVIKLNTSVKPVFIEGKDNNNFKYMFIPIILIN